jgi:exodeoxyribonuclease V alpha subunit
VIMVDEYAMVNIEMHRNLLDALKPGGCIRAFGDINQLPPIEEKHLRDRPSPFKEMLEAKHIRSIVLKTVHRQAEDSGIIYNANQILGGKYPRRLPDFSMDITENPVDALKNFIAENPQYDFSGINAQIICLQRKRTWVGTTSLNTVLQVRYRPEKDGWMRLPRHSWADDKNTRVRKGDKIIWTQNDYNLGILNGETGVIVDIDHEFGSLIIDFGGAEPIMVPPEVEATYGDKTFYYDPRKNMDLAYALTTHKTQGSEFDCVVYIMNRSAAFMQCRNNLYTGITRAKTRVHLITDSKSLTLSLWRTADKLPKVS